jgi:hypothetical protein
LYDTAIRVVETTLLTSTLLIEAMEFIPDVVVNRGIYTKDKYENNISRDPSQGKSVPERPDRQVAVSSFWYIGARIVDEGQRCHQERKYHPSCICVVAIWIESALTARMPRPEDV